jgi:murein DD-endopeptidase MepM/ murein hydrolase activator NlpD
MFNSKPKSYNGSGSGFCWVNSPSSGGIIRDAFGPRPFAYHVGTVGYDYDFHRGIDVSMDNGDPAYAPITGVISRLHFTYFGWEDDVQMEHWQSVNNSNSLSVALGTNQLNLTASRVGSITFPSGIDKFEALRDHISINSDDWVVETEFSALSTTGSLGMGVFNRDNTQYVCMDYDGTTFTIRAVDSIGNFTANGSTYSVSGKTWMRISFTLSTGTFTWSHSEDGTTWTDLTTETGKTFSTSVPLFKPTLYWKSADTNATPYSLVVKKINWQDLSQHVGRFGNWLQITQNDHKVIIMHNRSLYVSLGDYVSAGQMIAKIGKTGFDVKSGRVLYDHPHLEYIANNKYFYDNDEPINILSSGFLPRANVSNNVSCNVITENDPNSVSSWKMDISVSRQDQDFDMNQISLTGNLATRTINFNTRSGLNADSDIPVQDGVYIVAYDMNENSATYELDVYFNKSVVGTSLVSYEIRDTNGTILASG